MATAKVKQQVLGQTDRSFEADLFAEFRGTFKAQEEHPDSSQRPQRQRKPFQPGAAKRLLYKLKRLYDTNELVKYALWSFLLIFIASNLLFLFEIQTFRESVAENLGINNPSFLQTYFLTLWWSVVTFTTVGYGDVSPITPVGQFLAMLAMLANFAAATLLGGAVASVLVAKRLQGDKPLDESKYVGHTIICGWNPQVGDILRVMDNDQHANGVVILINESDPDLVERVTNKFSHLDITHLVGSYTHEEMLLKAFLPHASSVIIVPDYSGLLSSQSPDEQKTILATLAAKSIAEEVRVIAHVQDPENVSHLNRANCDEIVVTDAHTPELLANHVINPGVPQLIDDLFSISSRGHKLQVVDIPAELMGASHRKIFAYFKLTRGWLVLGYAIRKAGFSLEEAMAESGSELIRSMIKEQLEQSGINLSSDERVVVEINPDDDYLVDERHRVLILS